MLGVDSKVRKTSIVSYLYEDTPVYIKLGKETVVSVYLDKESGKVCIVYEQSKVKNITPINP